MMVTPPPSASSNSAHRLSSGSLSEDEDIFMTIDTENGGGLFIAAERPKVGLVKKDSFLQWDEKQISVDPISLKGGGPTTIRQASFRLVSPPPPPVPTASPRSGMAALPAPLKLKFVSASLPSSAASSPHSSRSNNKNLSFKKMWKNQQPSPSPRRANLMSEAMDDSQLEMRRIRSCAEGRSSDASAADDFELWLEKSSRGGINTNINHHQQPPRSVSRNFSKPPLAPTMSGTQRQQMIKKSISRGVGESFSDQAQDKFKCGKLCLFLPRGKGWKHVRSSSSASSTHQVLKTQGSVISRTVSLERFDVCGSWSSSSLVIENEDCDSANLFFDLPMELLRCSVSDMQSPVTAAFVFDEDLNNNNDDANTNFEDNREIPTEDKEPKGVIERITSKTNCQDSTGDVGLSTSSPTSYPSSSTSTTPQLRQATENSNAFLEAQST